jgi:SAM-dependent methyltransferase
MSNLTAEELAELGDGVVLVTPHTPAAIAEALGRQTILSAAKRQVYEDEALGLWTKFYARNEDKFYKDRHYIREVWAKYLIDPPGRTVMLEVGCGTGATIFPLLRRNPRLMAYACDFAETAVELVRTNQEFIPLHAAGRAEAFQADITLAEQLPGPLVAPGSVDVVTVIFVLGAIPPQKMPAAVANIARCLRSGGHVLLRDYGRHDQAQIRFASRLDDNLYVRTYDGTLAFYFEVDELKALFDEAGFDAVDVNYVTRNIVNRKKGIAMRRKWVHGVFRKR